MKRHLLLSAFLLAFCFHAKAWDGSGLTKSNVIDDKENEGQEMQNDSLWRNKTQPRFSIPTGWGTMGFFSAII